MIAEIRRATAPRLNRERKAQSTARIKPTASAAGSIRDNFGSNPDERKRFKPWLPSVHAELPWPAPISRSLPGSLQLLLPESPSWTDNPIPETCQLCTQNSDRAGSRRPDRKSTRLNSSHRTISYAVFCLKKKKKKQITYNHLLNKA